MKLEVDGRIRTEGVDYMYQGTQWFNFYKRWWNWNSWRKISRACDKASDRVGKMSQSERNELQRHALKQIFPNGYWTCFCIRYGHLVAKNRKCMISKLGETGAI